ncbi:MAG: hypothetical protein K6G90_13530 [Clostridia bacterium]|nr:hypothetical protein [Clostridia bacterium]
MTDREKYKKTFSALQPERDYLEKINNTGVIKMNERRRVSVPKLLAACIVIIAVIAALSAAAYAVDLGGIQRKIQIWTRGELTDVELNITTDGQYTVSYTDENGETRKSEGGGVAYDFFGRERPLSEEEIIEHLNEPQLMQEDDGRVMLYCRDQKLDLTDEFEDGVCHVKLTIDGKPLYITVSREGDTGYSMGTSPRSYPKP